jgi:hypothetical protein
MKLVRDRDDSTCMPARRTAVVLSRHAPVSSHTHSALPASRLGMATPGRPPATAPNDSICSHDGKLWSAAQIRIRIHNRDDRDNKCTRSGQRL